MDSRRRELLEPQRWKARAAAGVFKEGAEPIRKYVPGGVLKQTAEQAEQRVIPFVISDDGLDRDRDTINPKGWKTENYEANPVVLFGHDYGDLPVARSVALWRSGNQLLSNARFAEAELYPFADTVYRMYQERFMNAVSVGFLPEAWQFVESKDRPFGVDFEEQELLEYSTVPVPSNPRALQNAKASGINVAPLKDWAERVLDEGGQVPGAWVSRSELEALRKAAGGENGAITTFGRGLGVWTPDATDITADVAGTNGSRVVAARSTTTDGSAPSPAVTPTKGAVKMEGTDAALFLGALVDLRRAERGGAGDVEEKRRQASYLAARALPGVDAEEFAQLFPEVLRSAPAEQRDLSDDLRSAIEGTIAQLQGLLDSDGSGDGSGGDGDAETDSTTGEDAAGTSDADADESGAETEGDGSGEGDDEGEAEFEFDGTEDELRAAIGGVMDSRLNGTGASVAAPG